MRLCLLVAVLAGLLVPSAAGAQAQAPDDATSTLPATAAPPPGATEYGTAPAPKRVRALRVRAFEVTPAKLLAGSATSVTVRIDGGDAEARVRVVLVPRTARRAAATLDLGWRRTGIAIVRSWKLRALNAGAYTARVHAVDHEGRRLKRTASASGKQSVSVAAAPPAPAPPPAVATAPAPTGILFPVTGASWSFGGPDARFGAGRDGHIHQGQDITAPEGTPLVAPLAGTVFWRAVQDGGAGHYLVVRAVDGRDYVFMHLVAGSETVAKGDPVAAGQVIGAVGSTGDSTGPHLHFELWPNGWYSKGSSPIDPLPELQSWAQSLP